MEFFTRSGAPLAQGDGYHTYEETRFTCEAGYSFTDDGERLPMLYNDRSQCCGCGACEARCPVGAISMLPDSEGFLYPVVNASACVGCGACMDVCSFKGRVA